MEFFGDLRDKHHIINPNGIQISGQVPLFFTTGALDQNTSILQIMGIMNGSKKWQQIGISP